MCDAERLREGRGIVNAECRLSAVCDACAAYVCETSEELLGTLCSRRRRRLENVLPVPLEFINACSDIIQSPVIALLAALARGFHLVPPAWPPRLVRAVPAPD